MEKLNFTVDKRRAGKRLDKFLRDALQRRFSRSFIKKLIEDAKVTVGGKSVKAHYNVSCGEAVEMTIPEPRLLELKPENEPLDIVYQDSDIAVVNKSAGIAVHPAGPRLTGTLVNRLIYHCADLSGIGGVLRPGIVHRLDKDTSGLLVVAKNDTAHINLSNQFKNRTIKKTYIALVKGSVELDNGRIELPVARRKKDVTKMGISFADTRKKHAVTNYRVLKRFDGFTMLELSLETGRTHQIRVHLAHIGHPVIGDKLYGSARGLVRHALHAKTLGFRHPTKGEFMEFESDLPGDMRGLINKGKI